MKVRHSSLKMEEAKDIHTSLRKASGIMKFVQDTLLPQVIYNYILFIIDAKTTWN